MGARLQQEPSEATDRIDALNPRALPGNFTSLDHADLTHTVIRISNSTNSTTYN